MRDTLKIAADKLRLQASVGRGRAATPPSAPPPVPTHPPFACSPIPQMQAILLSTLCLLAACALPVASYVYVFRYSHQELGPFAWSLWAVAGATAALAILAHSVGSRGE